MKKHILVICLGLFICCKQMPAQTITKEELTKNNAFWHIKKEQEMKNKEINLFPEKADSLQTQELRRNRIYLRSGFCQFEAYVNDVLIYRMLGDVTKGGAGITGAIPINQNLLFSGEHEIKVRIFPMYGDTVLSNKIFLGMEFYSFINDLREKVYNDKMGGKTGVNIDNTDTDYKGDPRSQYNPTHNFIGLPVYEWRTTFEASVPFEQEAWLNSVNLKEESEKETVNIKRRLLDSYKKLHKIVSERDINAYLEAVKDREDRISTAFYFSKEEQAERTQEFIDLLTDKKYEVLPIVEETIVVEYQAYGKLGVLSDTRDGEGIIRVRNIENPDEEITLDFRFHRKQKGDSLTVI